MAIESGLYWGKTALNAGIGIWIVLVLRD